MSRSTSLGFPLLCGLAALSLLTLPGCTRRGQVSGKVLFMGQALSGGRVTFTSQENPACAVFSPIAEDGSYCVRSCPTGEVRITLQPSGRGINPARFGPQGPLAGSYLPLRHTDPASTSLVYQVESGAQSLDIEITP